MSNGGWENRQGGGNNLEQRRMMWKDGDCPPESGGQRDCEAITRGVVPDGTTPALRATRNLLIAAPCRACARSRSRLRRGMSTRPFPSRYSRTDHYFDFRILNW